MGAVVAAQTYLQLVQSLHQESGTSGPLLTTIANSTREWKRLCDWIAEAYVELQLARDDWAWMEADVVFNTVVGQQAYPPSTTTFTTPAGTGLADFRKWKLNSATGESSFRIYLASVGVNGEAALNTRMNYAQFRDRYMFGSQRNVQGQPISLAVDTNKSILLGDVPNDIYTVNGRYFKNAIRMDADADLPDLPAEYHKLIVYRALEKYGYFAAASEVIARATKAAKPLMRALEDAQLQTIQLPDPFV